MDSVWYMMLPTSVFVQKDIQDQNVKVIFNFFVVVILMICILFDYQNKRKKQKTEQQELPVNRP
jgi:predicted negative regulator of RcsB-dependent stress response